ncbi:MAG: WYL domain-containing protein [Candidatus Baltobacteraceae bacterium]
MTDPSDSADGRHEQAAFPFDPDTVRRANEAPEDSTRLIWLLLRLIRNREVDYPRYAGMFERGDRTFKRDIAKLRELGRRFGFELGKFKRGAIRVAKLDDALEPRRDVERNVADVLRALADALGEVVAADLRAIVELDAGPIDRFLRVGLPRLIPQTTVAKTYAMVRAAWGKGARVRFRYPTQTGGPGLERTVEPYLVNYVAGRYYLVGFDVRPRSGGWRQYALDRIEGAVRPAGTFVRRTVPPQYHGSDAVGLFKTGPGVCVTIALSARIAGAVTARSWQRSQRATSAPDGSATIAFEVFDLGEAVRWAFGFGGEARVVAPSSAVDLARDLAQAMLASYGVERANERSTG